MHIQMGEGVYLIAGDNEAAKYNCNTFAQFYGLFLLCCLMDIYRSNCSLMGWERDAKIMGARNTELGASHPSPFQSSPIWSQNEETNKQSNTDNGSIGAGVSPPIWAMPKQFLCGCLLFSFTKITKLWMTDSPELEPDLFYRWMLMRLWPWTLMTQCQCLAAAMVMTSGSEKQCSGARRWRGGGGGGR